LEDVLIREDKTPKAPVTISQIGILSLIGHELMYIEPIAIITIGNAADIAKIIVIKT
jgi:hypothetical protein